MRDYHPDDFDIPDDTPSLDDHPFSAVSIRAELGESDHDRDWSRYVRKVERLLGHGVDGDQDTCGFSLDRCGDFFADGLTAEECVEEFRYEIAALDAAFGPLVYFPPKCRGA